MSDNAVLKSVEKQDEVSADVPAHKNGGGRKAIKKAAPTVLKLKKAEVSSDLTKKNVHDYSTRRLSTTIEEILSTFSIPPEKAQELAKIFVARGLVRNHTMRNSQFVWVQGLKNQIIKLQAARAALKQQISNTSEILHNMENNPEFEGFRGKPELYKKERRTNLKTLKKLRHYRSVLLGEVTARSFVIESIQKALNLKDMSMPDDSKFVRMFRGWYPEPKPRARAKK